MAATNLAPKIITIEPNSAIAPSKLRVAAYARVSSNSEDQINSFEAQRRHFDTLIRSKSEWTMVELYADEGITGTSVDKRDGFLRMMADCRKGLIDRVLTKSISRFARNTAECLEAIRELKILGVSVYFEEQHLDTQKVSNEFLTTILANNAQRMSEDLSRNMRWSYQRRMRRGEFITCKAPFGYKWDHGGLKIVESEADIVRKIFQMYLSGVRMDEIAEYVTSLGVKTSDNKEHWNRMTVSYILRNEKYVGDTIAQKQYTTDSLPFKERRNHGERDRFFIKNSHPPIVKKEVFDKVQSLLKRRSQNCLGVNASDHAFSLKIYCGQCGSVYRRRCRKGFVTWVCRRHDESASQCESKPIREAEIQTAFLRIYHKLKRFGTPILSELQTNLREIQNRRYLWSPEIIEINQEISNLAQQIHLLADLQKVGMAGGSAYFIARTNELKARMRQLSLERARLVEREEDDPLEQTEALVDTLESGPEAIDTFDSDLFRTLVERITVESASVLRFRLANGLELREVMERTAR